MKLRTLLLISDPRKSYHLVKKMLANTELEDPQAAYLPALILYYLDILKQSSKTK